jgi:hypothetical protein
MIYWNGGTCLVVWEEVSTALVCVGCKHNSKMHVILKMHFLGAEKLCFHYSATVADFDNMTAGM